MRVIRAADCRRMPWRNGGGETVEIATHPEGAGLDDFAWRLSAARVARDGPFSVFPDVDRTLAVLSGEGLELRIADETTRLGPGDAPLPFPGDRPTVGRLLGGPVEDLNIMTRRGAARHRMRRLTVRDEMHLAIAAPTVLVFCAEGSIVLDGVALAPRDTAMLAGDRNSPVHVDGSGALYVIEVETAS